MITQRTPRSFGYSVLMIALATSAFAQFDTQHDHLKCYKITGGAIVTKVQTDNQFGREMIFKLVPKFLCAPTQKTCVATDGSCGKPGAPSGDPVRHFKCYKVAAKECPNDNCTELTGRFAPVPAELIDQFGTEQVNIGVPKMLCAPVEKIVTRSTTTTTQCVPPNCPTTTTTMPCASDSDCPGAAGSGRVCIAGTCGCNSTTDCFPDTFCDPSSHTCQCCGGGLTTTTTTTTSTTTTLRFVDNTDGTVTDNETGLQWEQKVAGSSCLHCVNDTYIWSSSGTAPDGTAFTSFLATMNGGATGVGNCTSGDGSTQTGGFNNHCDWRLPTIAELRTILDTSQGQCGAGSGACIDPTFGPTGASRYWSSTTSASNPFNAWFVSFFGGFASSDIKTDNFFVRAVRGGS